MLLTSLNEDQLNNYMSNLSKDEVIAILIEYDIPYKNYWSKNKLIALTAHFLSNLGVYQRISNEGN